MRAVVVANEYHREHRGDHRGGVIAAIDATGRVAMFNRAAEAAHRAGGRTPRKGGPAAVLPAIVWRSRCWRLRATDRARTQPEVELATVAPTAEGPASRPVICTISPVRDPVGAVLGAVAVVSDLTPLKELEVERRDGPSSSPTFQALASGIAHEIKNPLVAIKTFSRAAAAAAR